MNVKRFIHPYPLLLVCIHADRGGRAAHWYGDSGVVGVSCRMTHRLS